ncbi:MAG: acyl-CoA transferase [Betaproteobacteria bacterium]|nr:acyl-CoA transferase [Betaproteobacteria bacterium]
MVLPLDALPQPSGAAPIALLAGVRVIDLTTSIAGPYATMLLADMGADVVKIERPGSGDDSRAWGPPFLDGESLWFLSVNRNKRSMTLDYTADAGRNVLHDLVRTADVVVVNLVARVQKKLGVDHHRLKALKPDLVHVSISGFGLDGARRDFPCYDLIAEGYSGVMDLTGEADSPPQKVGTPAADLIAGMDASYATVAALFERSRSGRGHAIDISMIDSMTRFMSPRIVPYLGSGEVPKRTGARDSVIAVYQVFETSDDPITLGLGNDAIWKRFWEAVGRPELGGDARYATNADRRAAREDIVAEIQSVLATRSRDEWLKLFVAAKVPAGPVNRVDQVSGDPELVARGLFYSDTSNGRRIPQVGLGIGIDGSSASYRTPPPRLGEHTDEVLREVLGYDDAKIESLREQKAI